MTTELSWWLNQVGIAVEICGAAYLVWCAWHSKQATRGMETHTDGAEDTINGLIAELRGNFKTQLRGFFALAFGMTLQFLSNFGGT